jgi:hypothetical protein
MTMQNQVLEPGQQISCDASDFATVVLHRVDNGHAAPAFLVYVEHGGYRPEGWEYSYDNETTARFEATRAARLFAKYGTADRIEARRAELIRVRDEQRSRQLRRMHNPQTLADAEAELDALMSFGDMVMLAELKARMDALYAA